MNKIAIALLTGTALFGASMDNFVKIPSGTFEMGDHAGLGGGDTKHPSDEVPLHMVTLAPFSIEKFEITNTQYAEFLNSQFSSNLISISSGGFVTLKETGDTLFLTGDSVTYSRITFDGSTFSASDNRGNHPVSNIRWKGAIAYCNWLSGELKLDPCYTLSTGDCDFSKNGIRLPTEAEWEYAALGGLKDPYPIFPWGNDSNLTGTLANWEKSNDPYETGDTLDYPWTTPVGFYDGTNHLKADFGWKGAAESYQTQDAKNGYGLYDVSGNVWEFVNDWYLNPYYGKSPTENPQGPTETEAGAMPDGKKYKAMRGGNWYNGAQYFGHGRVSNRNPSYFRGPLDPIHPYYHIGFRVVTTSEPAVGTVAKSSVVKSSPFTAVRSGDNINLTFAVNRAGEAVLKLYRLNGKCIDSQNLGSFPEGRFAKSISCTGYAHGMVIPVLEIGGVKYSGSKIRF